MRLTAIALALVLAVSALSVTAQAPERTRTFPLKIMTSAQFDVSWAEWPERWEATLSIKDTGRRGLYQAELLAAQAGPDTDAHMRTLLGHCQFFAHLYDSDGYLRDSVVLPMTRVIRKSGETYSLLSSGALNATGQDLRHIMTGKWDPAWTCSP